MPSMRRCGSFSIMTLSLNVPGSPSSALQQRYLARVGSFGMKLHLRPVEKPPPARYAPMVRESGLPTFLRRVFSISLLKTSQYARYFFFGEAFVIIVVYLHNRSRAATSEALD